VQKHQLASILQKKAFVRGTTMRALQQRLAILQDIVDSEHIPEVLQREPGILSASLDTIRINRGRVREGLHLSTCSTTWRVWGTDPPRSTRCTHARVLRLDPRVPRRHASTPRSHFGYALKI